MPRYITNGHPNLVLIVFANRYKIIIISAGFIAVDTFAGNVL
jgi:hypothetical protein